MQINLGEFEDIVQGCKESQFSKPQWTLVLSKVAEKIDVEVNDDLKNKLKEVRKLYMRNKRLKRLKLSPSTVVIDTNDLTQKTSETHEKNKEDNKNEEGNDIELLWKRISDISKQQNKTALTVIAELLKRTEDSVACGFADKLMNTIDEDDEDLADFFIV